MTSSLQKIVAIGGGEISRPKKHGNGYYPAETTYIDKDILQLTNSNSATLLFIPTASNDSTNYYDAVKKHFLKIGFTSVNVLYLLDRSLTKTQIKKMILSHDAIYVGGGDTIRMLATWQSLGVDKMLKEALEKGIVLSGLSAGSICWFAQGISDSSQTVDNSNGLVLVMGLGFIDAIHCPHYDTDPHRQSFVKQNVINTNRVAICLDDCTALEVVGNEYRILKSNTNAKAHRAYWENDRYCVEEIDASDSFKSIDSLLRK